MKFDKVSAVANIVHYLKEADLPRAQNRALINSLFNGDQPWSAREAEENNVNVNVNFLDAPRIAHEARNTLNNAILKPGNFFKVTLTEGPVHKVSAWSKKITKLINKPLKKSKPYRETLKAMFAQAVLHGVGPCVFPTTGGWCPEAIGVEDLLIPSRVRASFDNLEYFAVFRQYTPSRLFRKTHGKYVDKGWNKKKVDLVLKEYREKHVGPTSNDYSRFPEKLEEDLKANLAFMENESVPTIDMWEFYYQDEESETETWKKKIILNSGTEDEMADDFIYESKDIAHSVEELIHVLFADGANVAPFRYHSIRGLGWLLYSVCHLQNRLMCKVTDSAFEQLMWYFYVSNPEERERTNKIDLHHWGIFPEGTQFVKAQDRYQPNPTFINQALAMNRQNMAESSAQFRQDIDNGTNRQMTAQEAMARMQSAQTLVSSTIGYAASQMVFQFREIARRFCDKKSSDSDVKEFLKKAKEEGIPEKYLDVDMWEIEPEVVLGDGNKALEIAQAKELLAIRPLLDPEAQREVDHMYVEAATGNPQLAQRLVPPLKEISDTVTQAQLSAGALLQGMPVAVRRGINRSEYVESLLVSLSMVLDRISKTTNMADAKEIYGLKNLVSHISQNISLLAQDKAEAEKVKNYGDALNQFVNLIKGLEQRFMEQEMSQQNGNLSEGDAKIQERLLLAQTNAKIKEDNNQQKLRQKDEAFLADQARKNAALQNDLKRGLDEATLDVEVADIKTAAEIRRTNELAKTQRPNP